MRSAMLVMLLAWTGALAAGQVYKSVGPDGRVIYSDRPAPGAEAIDVAPVQTYPSSALPAGTASEPPAPPAGFEGYQTFRISRPENDQALRDNAGSVVIDLELAPALRPEHKINIFMDGKSLGGEGRTTSLALNNVDRGSHSIYAVVVDAGGEEVARTPSITFHLKRVSVN